MVGGGQIIDCFVYDSAFMVLSALLLASLLGPAPVVGSDSPAAAVHPGPAS